ncbi:hypothetical protein ACFQS2_14405 [Brachybacterium sp. GCM10030267]|uniref:hypothetical protein n=1 Tax=unclassified Brachybacterium TaxID=2623841 RepID=UPI003624134E
MHATQNQRESRPGGLLLVAAIISICLSFGFSVDRTGLRWFWTETPWVAPGLVLLGVVLGALYVLMRGRAARRR